MRIRSAFAVIYADLARRTPITVRSTPTTATTGPTISHVELFDMKLPPIVPKPCSAQNTPTITSTTPTTANPQFRTMHPTRSGQPRRREGRGEQNNSPR